MTVLYLIIIDNYSTLFKMHLLLKMKVQKQNGTAIKSYNMFY